MSRENLIVLIVAALVLPTIAGAERPGVRPIERGADAHACQQL